MKTKLVLFLLLSASATFGQSPVGPCSANDVRGCPTQTAKRSKAPKHETKAEKICREWNAGAQGGPYEWTAEDCERIGKHEVWIGMTIDQLHASKGLPYAVNTTHTPGVVESQLVYQRFSWLAAMNRASTGLIPDCYVYVQNGVVVAIQTEN
jgi:hypothetical protein